MSDRKQAISTSSEKSKRILEFLRKELMLPAQLTRLRLEFNLDDVIRVDCSFVPVSADTGPCGLRRYAMADDGQVIDVTTLGDR